MFGLGGGGLERGRMFLKGRKERSGGLRARCRGGGRGGEGGERRGRGGEGEGGGGGGGLPVETSAFIL